MELVDFYVLKDGLPIFSKEENRRSEYECQESSDQLTMISGFLCAVSSFASNLGRYGSMRELSMSEHIKITFHKEQLRNSELLFVLITKDSDSYEVNRRLLMRLAGRFYIKFRNELNAPWNGDVERFNCFYNEMMRDYDEFMHDMRVREHILYLKQREILARQIYSRSRGAGFSCFQENERSFMIRDANEGSKPRLDSQISHVIPIPKVENSTLIESVSLSNFAIEVFQKIDGNKSLQRIAGEMNVSVQEVFNVCKSFVKSGFVVFTQ